MATQPFWLDEEGEEKAWNFVWLGEDLLPGLAEVEIEKGRAVDVQKSKGNDGPTLKDEGYEGARLTITLRMWTRDQWYAYQEMYPRIDPQNSSGERAPLTIINPEANLRGVDTVYVTKIRGSTPRRGGTKVETIECVQWFPAPKPAKTSQKPKLLSDDPLQFGPPPPPDPENIF